jgi:hypothetical protein
MGVFPFAVVLAALAAAGASSSEPAPDEAPSPAAAGGGTSASGSDAMPAWVSLSGSGLFALPDTATLAPKRFNLDGSADNQDRDPFRLDLVDLGVAWTYGIGRRAETYGHAVLSRAVSVSPRQDLVPPPVDVVVPAGVPMPARPYYGLYAPFPYVGRKGTSQINEFVPGDLVVGGKVRLLDADGARPALAVSGELKVPLTKSRENLESGAGTAAWDETVRVTAEWRTRRQSFVGSVGFTHVGQPPFGDRQIVFRPGDGGDVTDLPLELSDRLLLGVGVRHVLARSAALVAELTKTAAVGPRTAAFEEPGPLDVAVGAQLRWGRFHFTLALRHHLNSVPENGTRPSPFGGFADMTGVSRSDLQAYLQAIGAGGIAGDVRDGQIALALPPGAPPLPAGAQILPPAYTVTAHGGIAYLFVWGWSFGGRR